MNLRKFARFAWVLGAILLIAGVAWIVFQKDDLFDDDNFPGLLLSVTGGTLLAYTIRTLPLLEKRVYENTQSIDNDLLFSDSGDFVAKGIGAFNFTLAILSAFGMIGVSMFSVYFWAWFLERPRLSKINEADEIIGMLMAVVVTICVVPAFMYVLRTYDRKYIYEEQ
jgi:drug/metabolite transporter (DMT)-like permease